MTDRDRLKNYYSRDILYSSTECTEKDHIVEINHKITMKEIDLIAETECAEIDHIIGIYHETTIRMTIEGTVEMTIEIIIEMTTEMIIEKTTEMTTEKKIIGIFRDLGYKRKHKDYYKDTYDIDYHRTSCKARSKNKYQNKDRYRDDSYNKTRCRAKEKDYLYDGDDILDSENQKSAQI